MPSAWREDQILQGADQDTARKWVHGLLKQITVQYYKWGGTVDGEKQPSTEITYEEYVKLPRGQGGEKVNFEIDPAVLNPSLQFTTTRGVFRGFPDWKRIVGPSINDAIAENTDHPLLTFAKRAATESWYVECELVSVKNKNGNVNEVPKFTRMTQDLEVLREWREEQFPRYKTEVPQDMVDSYHKLFNTMSRKKPDPIAHFTAMVGDDEEANVYLSDLVQLAQGWLNE